jgi:hypothetical protein
VLNDHCPFSLTLMVGLVAVEVTDAGRQATQLLLMGAPFVASRSTPDTTLAPATCGFPTARLGDRCSKGAGATDGCGGELAVTSGVATTDWDADSEPVGVTEGSGDTVGLGDADADGVVGVGSSAAANGLATTLSASPTEAAPNTLMIRPNGELGRCLIAPPGV